MPFWTGGWSFSSVLAEDGVAMSAYEDDIMESLHVLFSTIVK